MTMVQAVLVLIALAVIANLALMGAALLTERRRLREGVPSDGGLRVVREPTEPHPALRFRTLDLSTTTVSPEAFDRVVRVVAWIFLLSTTTIVAVTGLWKDNQAAILVLLALGRVLRPGRPRSRSRRVAGQRQVHRRRFRRHHLRRDPRPAHGPGQEPVLLHLPADRGRRGARGLPAGDARAGDHGEHRLPARGRPRPADPFPPATVARWV